MSFRDSLLRFLASARAITGPAGYAIRMNAVTVRTRTWSGTVVGEGTYTDSDLVLPAHYPVRYLRSQEISTSAGVYEVGDVLVDHITPRSEADPTIGYTLDELRPQFTTDNVEVIHLLVGSHAGEYKCLEVRNFKPFSIQLVLRRRGNIS